MLDVARFGSYYDMILGEISSLLILLSAIGCDSHLKCTCCFVSYLSGIVYSACFTENLFK